MIRIRTDGYYVTKVPDTVVDLHAGIRMEWQRHTFLKFYADGIFSKYLKREFDQKHEELVAARVLEFREDPDKRSYANVVVGRYKTDRRQVFTDGTIAGERVIQSFTIISPDELLDENLKEYEFKESKIE